MSKRSAVDDQHKPTGALTVVVTNKRRHTRVHAMERVAGTSLLLLRLVQANAVVPQNAALGEEVLDSGQHLHVYRHGPFASAADNDDVVIAADEVCAMTNRYLHVLLSGRLFAPNQ